jgi:hypothetical protein
LRAVDQREAFFRAEGDRREARLLQGIGRRHGDAFKHSLALAQHRRRHMRERGKIARGANRALIGDHWRHAFREHPLNERNRLPSDTRGATPKAEKLQSHHQSRGRLIERFAHAAAMREDQVALERRRILRRDLDAGKLAEAGIDPIDRRIPLRRRPNQRCSRLDAGAGRGVKPHSRAAAPDLFQKIERRRARIESDGHSVPPKIRAWIGLNPMR